MFALSVFHASGVFPPGCFFYASGWFHLYPVKPNTSGVSLRRIVLHALILSASVSRIVSRLLVMGQKV